MATAGTPRSGRPCSWFGCWRCWPRPAPLFLGEVMGKAPCVLCWYQRIAMFPLVLVLGLGLFTSDARSVRYALPLAAVGWSIAAYHLLVFWGVVSEGLVPCGRGRLRRRRRPGGRRGADSLLSLTAFSGSWWRCGWQERGQQHEQEMDRSGHCLGGRSGLRGRRGGLHEPLEPGSEAGGADQQRSVGQAALARVRQSGGEGDDRRVLRPILQTCRAFYPIVRAWSTRASARSGS